MREKQKARDFKKELQTLINSFSLENNSDTPDFVLAAHLDRCLENFNKTMAERSKFFTIKE